MIRVLIAGEGPDEIGLKTADWPEGPRPADGGAIEALMAKVRPTGWQVRKAIPWKNVRKLRVNVPHGDARTVHALALQARESGCNALVFLRDRDGDAPRERAIRAAIEKEEPGAPPIAIAGGVAIEMLECWLLALRGEKNAHTDGAPAASLHARHGVKEKSAAAMVQLIRKSKPLDAPADAQSLWKWLRRLAVALNVKIPNSWR